MGTEESKSQVNHQGDANVKIINNQIEHTKRLDDHEVLLWVMLAIVATQLAITLLRMLNRFMNKKALKKAEALTKLSNVSIHRS